MPVSSSLRPSGRRIQPPLRTATPLCSTETRRDPHRRCTLLLWVLAIAAAATSVPLHAQEGAGTHTSLVVLADASGSMRQSDPSCVRGEAVALLLDLLPQGDRVAIAEFGDRTKDLTPGWISLDQRSKGQLKTAGMSCGQSAAYTDIGSALARALALVASMTTSERAAYPPHVVLLTDGRNEVARGVTSPDPRTVASELFKSGAIVHVLGLGPGASTRELADLAAAGGGRHSHANTAQDLKTGFLGISRVLAKRWLISDRDARQEPGDALQPGWASDARFVWLAPSGVSPSYRVFSGPKEVPRFDGGRLIVDASGQLSVVPKLPSRVPVGYAFPCVAEVRPVSAGSVAGARFLDDAVVSLVTDATGDQGQMYDDGLHGDGAKADGVFGGACRVSSPGSAKATLTLRTERLDAPSVTATLSGISPAVSVKTQPWLVAMARATIGSPMSAVAENATDVPLKGRVIIEGQTQPFELPPQGVATLTRPALGDASSLLGRANITVLLDGVGEPVWIGDAPNPSALALPLILAATLGLIGATFMFPRRGLSKCSVSLTVSTATGDVEWTGIGHIGADGRAVFRDVPPMPFGDPGRFARQSGFWRSGVVFEPTTASPPRFLPPLPARLGQRFVAKQQMNWVWSSNGYEAKYRLTAQ